MAPASAPMVSGWPRSWRWAVMVLLLGVLTIAPKLGFADEKRSCPESKSARSDTSACGPTFVLPQWADGSPLGWDQPKSYRTMRLGNVDTDPGLELVVRAADGLYIEKFRKEWGQWVTLPASPSSVPFQDFSDANGWDQPEYYSTIQLADIDGDGRAELLSRGSDGMNAHRYNSSALRWEALVTHSGVFPDSLGWTKPEYYTTIQFADVTGDGRAEMFGRGGDGLWSYTWEGAGASWQPLAPMLPDFSDASGWNRPEYYTTIQFADIDGDGRAEVLSRGVDGMNVFRYNLSARAWQAVVTHSGVFPDAQGWTSPQYYATIRFADVTGDGRAEMFGRGRDGLHAYRWDKATESWSPLASVLTDLSDSSGWDQPQYYTTIQFADIDGDGRAELLARSSTGLQVWRWSPSTHQWQKLVTDLPRLTDSALANDPDSWSNESHYATIRTGDVDGSGQAELVARGTYGLRTWRFDPGQPQQPWQRPRPYGFPEFTDAAQTAFNELNARFLGFEQDTIRTRYTTSDTGTLSTWAGLISARCSDLQQAAPPRYAGCTPPDHDGYQSTPAAWTEVSNQILAELFWAVQVINYFGTLDTAYSKLFQDESSNELPAIDAQLQLSQATHTTTQFNILGPFGVFANVLKMLAIVPDVGPLLALAGNTIATSMSALPSSLESQITGTYSDLTAKIADVLSQNAANQENLRTQLANQETLVLEDAGLLSAVGSLTNAGIWKALSKDDENRFQQIGRRGFALWAYQQLLPALWNYYAVSNCVDGSRRTRDFWHYTEMVVYCESVLPAAYVQSRPDNITFNALLESTSGCSVFPCTECDPQVEGTRVECGWNVPHADVVGILWDPVSADCAASWVYGCNLGVGSEIFENRDGWNFRKYTCDPWATGWCPPKTGVTGRAQGVGAGEGSIELFTVQVHLGPLDLRNARATITHLLHEAAGTGELIDEVADGLALAPSPGKRPLMGRVLTPGPGGPNEKARHLPLVPVPGNGLVHAKFRLAGARSQGELHLRLLDGLLEARVILTRASLRALEGCRDDGRTELITRLVIEDGINLPVTLHFAEPWECVVAGDGVVRTLRRQGHPHTPGDVNGDGTVDVLDLSLLGAELQRKVGESLCGPACDLDGDGRITRRDERRMEELCTHPDCAVR